MRAIPFVLCAVLTLAQTPAPPGEVAVPDTPVTATVKAYAVTSIYVQHSPEYRFSIAFTNDQGKASEDLHIGPSYSKDPVTGAVITNPEGAEHLIKQLNTANMSVKSMNRRALEHLVAHGKIPPSTVQGTPVAPVTMELDRAPVVPKPTSTPPPPKPPAPVIKKAPEVFQLEVDKTKPPVKK